jgi:hypothetical protein
MGRPQTKGETMTMYRLFSSGEVAEVAGLAMQTVDRWASIGLVQPVGGGARKGIHRQYSFMQLFAVYVGARYRDERADDGRVAGVVKYLASIKDSKWFEAELAKGRTFPVPAGMLGGALRPVGWLPGMMVRIGHADTREMSEGAKALLERLDCQRLYDACRQKTNELLKKPRRQRGQRRRVAR